MDALVDLRRPMAADPARHRSPRRRHLVPVLLLLQDSLKGLVHAQDPPQGLLAARGALQGVVLRLDTAHPPHKRVHRPADRWPGRRSRMSVVVSCHTVAKKLLGLY